MRNKIDDNMQCPDCGRDHSAEDDLRPGDICPSDLCPANQEAEIATKLNQLKSRIISYDPLIAQDKLFQSAFNYLEANNQDFTDAIFGD